MAVLFLEHENKIERVYLILRQIFCQCLQFKVSKWLFFIKYEIAVWLNLIGTRGTKWLGIDNIL